MRQEPSDALDALAQAQSQVELETQQGSSAAGRPSGAHPGPQDGSGVGIPLWMVFAVSGAMAVIVACMCIFGYDYLTKRNSRFGVVDLQSVLDAKQIEFTEMALRPGATDRDRENALSLAQEVSESLVKSIDEVAIECNCVLLVRAAVVGSAVPDHTKSLMAKMGMSPEKLEAAKKRLSEVAKRQANNTSADLAESVLGVRKPLVQKNK